MQTAKQLNVRRKSKRLPHKVVIDRTQWLCPRCFRMKELKMTYFYTEEKVHHFGTWKRYRGGQLRKDSQLSLGPSGHDPRPVSRSAAPPAPAILRLQRATPPSSHFHSYNCTELDPV